MTYRDVMEMPIRAFWVFSSNVARIRAEADQRALKLLLAVQSGEALQETFEGLRKEIKQPMVAIDNRRDPDATNKLRQILSG